MNSALIYGDVSPNIIDGSSIWMVSIAEVCSRLFDNVTVLLKFPLENETLVSVLRKIDNVELVEPPVEFAGKGMTQVEAASLATRIVGELGADAVIVRGFEACNAFCQQPVLAPVLWSYVTDLPFPISATSENNLNRLRRVAMRSHRMFAQTEASRSYLESLTPPAAGKTVLIPPMIPETKAALRPEESIGTLERPLRIVYSGKMAAQWKTLEMLELPRVLRSLGIMSELTVVGDKYNRNRSDATWVGRMQEAFRQVTEDEESGVQWLGAISREESLAAISQADMGLGWRTDELDSSLEISTKALEYGICRVAPVINRNSDHVSLYGEDFPFYVTADTDVHALAEMIASQLPNVRSAAETAFSVSTRYTISAAITHLGRAFERAGALDGSTRRQGESPVNQPVKIAVASHDLKFMGEIMGYLETQRQFEVRQDKWTTLHDHDEDQSRAIGRWADVVFCEWAGPSLAWFSHNLEADTRLVSRLHRFEMNGSWMADVDWERVDTLVFVSDFIRREVCAKFDIDESKTIVIPNMVDVDDFDRAKMPGARYHVGMLGWVPSLKRLDRALDLMEVLLDEDPRYTFHLKGRLPWEYPHEWNKPQEQRLYLDALDRIARSPSLGQRVSVEPFSADVASWHRGIGFILSPSDLESFHLAAAEGMAAGSVPIVWDRPGSKGIFDEWVVNGIEEAAERVLELRDDKAHAGASQRVKAFASRWDSASILPRWQELFSTRR